MLGLGSRTAIMQTTSMPIVDVKSVVVGCFILLALGSVGGKLFDIIQLLYGPLASCIILLN